jgi:hypothetical protein
MVAYRDPNSLTILTIIDKQWYRNHTPLINPFPDIHLLAQFALDTVTYEEPTIPPFQNIGPWGMDRIKHT